MFSILRNIRRKLLGVRFSAKYFAYAIGEFILIVAGILVALQINNWNEQRKSIKQGQEYLRQIYQDIQLDVENITDVIDLLKVQYERSITALEAIESPKEQFIDSTAVYHAIKGGPALSVPVERKRNTWDGLRSTGNLGILRNGSVVEFLTHYYDLYDFHIYHFNQLPHKVREELRRYLSSTNSAKVIREFEKQQDWTVYTRHSHVQLKEWIEDSIVKESLRIIATSSTVNLIQFNDLRAKADSIIIFMERDLPYIIHAP